MLRSPNVGNQFQQLDGVEGEGIREGIGNEAGKFYRDESNESTTPIEKNIQKSSMGGINKEAQLESQD